MKATAAATRDLLIRAYSATVGATDGNIIAAIITTQTPRNQPKVPRAVQGPSSMPRIWSAVHHQPSGGQGEEHGDEPQARAHGGDTPGEGPSRLTGWTCSVMSSGGPREVDFDRPVLPSYSMPKALMRERFASAIVRSDPTGWNIPENCTGSPVSTPNGTMSWIWKSIASSTRTLCSSPSSSMSIAARSTPSISPISGASARHRPTQLAAEDLDELVELRVGRLLVDEHADPPVAFGHHLRGVGDERDLAPGDVGAVDRSLADVEDKGDAAEVVGRPMVEGHVAGAHELAGAGLPIAAP